MTRRSTYVGLFLMRLGCRVLVWSVTLVSTGCGGRADEFATAPVQGRVSIDGKPLANAQIIFTPERGPSATAVTEADGTFVLSSHGNGDGAVVGRHLVTVMAREASREDMKGSPLLPVPGRNLIPMTYGDPTTSGLEFQVKEGQQNSFEIQLSSQANR